MKRPSAIWLLAFLALLLSSGSAMAFTSYLTGFATAYPASTSGNNASCNLCHSSGGGTDVNAYGKDWATKHNSGLSVAAAYAAIEGLNSDSDPTGSTNIVEITANAQPGWTPGPNNTLYDPFALVQTVTNQNPPTITGNLLDPAPANQPPALQNVVLRRVHGGAGTFDLPLSLVAPPAVNHSPTTEPRAGPTHQLVYTYDKPLNNATVNVTEGTAVRSSSLSGSTVVVNLTGVTNAQYVTVSLTNVGSTDGGTGGTGEARVGFLQGDVNQSRVVSIADLGLVNAQLSQLVTGTNFLKDVNASGTLTLADKGITNANLTIALPAP